MIKRDMTDTVKRIQKGFPIIGITGPRQSGKTTFARMIFPHKPYVSLEDPDIRRFALSDPRSFLSRYPEGAVIDEAQRVPELFSYLQSLVDEKKTMGLFILTGSQQFGLRSHITQSLAGRVGMTELLPFSSGELKQAGLMPERLETAIYTGSYPPVYDRKILPGDWYPGYVASYIERDLHQLINVRDLHTFQLFLKMCAARTGQILNLSSMASDCGITHNTAKAWISVLEASYIIFLLNPHFRNFSKRLIKSPKLYFHDTGLASYLLGITDENQITTHSMRGALFENWVISELVKKRFNQGMPGNLYFWRDRAGNEIDIIAENGEKLIPVEIKSGLTIADDFFRNLINWKTLAGKISSDPILVYGGEDSQVRNGIKVIPWKDISENTYIP